MVKVLMIDVTIALMFSCILRSIEVSYAPIKWAFP